MVPNPLLYVLQPWIGVVQLGGGRVNYIVGSRMGTVELYWSSYRQYLPVTKPGVNSLP